MRVKNKIEKSAFLVSNLHLVCTNLCKCSFIYCAEKARENKFARKSANAYMWNGT